LIPKTKVSRPEDFVARGAVPPAERLKAYQEQSKGLSRRLQGRFWLEVLERDHEVKSLVQDEVRRGAEQARNTDARRSQKWKRTRRM
jgi:hypothetical protein